MDLDLLVTGPEEAVLVPVRLTDVQQEPAASSSGTYAASSLGSATSRRTSMNGLAASPGTDVEPTCSTATATDPSACLIRAATSAYCLAQAASGADRWMGPW